MSGCAASAYVENSKTGGVCCSPTTHLAIIQQSTTEVFIHTDADSTCTSWQRNAAVFIGGAGSSHATVAGASVSELAVTPFAPATHPTAQ